MEAVIPWDRLLERIRPHYYAPSGQSRKPHDLEFVRSRRVRERRPESLHPPPNRSGRTSSSQSRNRSVEALSSQL